MRRSFQFGPDAGVAGFKFGGSPVPIVYEIETEALVARMTTPPTTVRKMRINDLIKSLKTAGVWSKLDTFYICAAADAQAARLDWKDRWPNLSLGGSPAFTADRGFKGDGVMAELSLPYALGSQSGDQYKLNDAVLGSLFLNENPQLSYHVSQAVGTTLTAMHFRRQNGGTFGDRLNHGVNTAISAPGTGSYTLITSRLSAPGYSAFVHGAKSDIVQASTSLPGGAVYFNRSTSNYGQDRMSWACWGAGLSDAQAVALHNAIAKYMQNVGAL